MLSLALRSGVLPPPPLDSVFFLQSSFLTLPPRETPSAQGSALQLSLPAGV